MFTATSGRSPEGGLKVKAYCHRPQGLLSSGFARPLRHFLPRCSEQPDSLIDHIGLDDLVCLRIADNSKRLSPFCTVSMCSRKSLRRVAR
jgi:hypothetical protein